MRPLSLLLALIALSSTPGCYDWEYPDCQRDSDGDVEDPGDADGDRETHDADDDGEAQ